MANSRIAPVRDFYEGGFIPRGSSKKGGVRLSIELAWSAVPGEHGLFWKDKLGIKLGQRFAEGTVLQLLNREHGRTDESLLAKLFCLPLSL